MQQQQLQSQQEQEKMKIDAEALEAEKDRRKDILIAEIRSAGFGSMADIDKNMQSDYQDAMEDIRKTEQYQEQTDLQREKEVNRMNNESSRNQIEREKIQAQKEIADKQLQIARENKNKYDTNSRREDT